jgi:hypothetical protein
MRLRLFGAAVAAAAMSVSGAAVAHGGGPPVAVFTDVVKGTDVVPFAGPCGGAPGTVEIEFTDIFHVTDFGDGRFVIKSVQAGTFDFTPDDPAAAGSSGRYRNGFTDVSTSSTFSSTSVFTVVGKNENGERVRFQVRSHFTFANGDVRVDHFTVNCP